MLGFKTDPGGSWVEGRQGGEGRAGGKPAGVAWGGCVCWREHSFVLDVNHMKSISEAQSYENVSEAPDWGLQPDTIKQQDSSTSDQDSHDYEVVTDTATAGHHGFEASLPDYVSVENISTEDYDDIGGDDEACSEEDYDDVV